MSNKKTGELLIALAELDISWEEKEKNKEKCRRMAGNAAIRHVDLLIFPEMTLTGFSMNIEEIAEERENSKTLEFFLKLSKEYKLAIAFGMAELIAEDTQVKKAENKCYLVSDGNILLEYAKLHPFTYGEEGKHYKGGTRLFTAELNHIRLAPLICYDLRFPEPFQILSAQTDFIFIIANWPLERVEHWNALLKARAIENQCYIAGINRCGNDPMLVYPLSSAVYDPYGNRMEVCQKNNEVKNNEKENESKEAYQELLDGNLYFAKIEKSIVQKYREEFPLKKDRRENLYHSEEFRKPLKSI